MYFQILLCKERDVTASGSPWHKLSTDFRHGHATSSSFDQKVNLSKGTSTFNYSKEHFLIPQSPINPNSNQSGVSQMALIGNIKDNIGLIRQQQQHHSQVLTSNHIPKAYNTATNFLKQENRQQVINEIAASLADEKVHSEPLVIIPSTSFNDAGQPSPASSTQSITSQVLKMQAASESQSDALLSSVNYNDTENPQDGPFTNVRVPSNMSNLSIDDSFLGSMAGNNTVNTGSGTFENLFADGDSNMAAEYSMEAQQDLSLSPHTGFNVTGNTSLTMADQGEL